MLAPTPRLIVLRLERGGDCAAEAQENLSSWLNNARDPVGIRPVVGTVMTRRFSTDFVRARASWWPCDLVVFPSTARRYGDFAPLGTWVGLVVLIGLTWAFFQHLLSGIRHLIMDTGENFELRGNKTSAIATFVGAVLLTALVWFYVLGVAK